MKDSGPAQIWWMSSYQQTMYECDCACSTAPPLSRTGPEMNSQPWQLTPGLYHRPLPQGHTLAFNPLAPAGVAVLNPQAQTILDSFTTPAPLGDSTARHLAMAGLLQAAGTAHPPLRAEPDMLTAWLHVTNQCNLRCPYCYVNQSPQVMDPATGQAAIEAVFRAATRRGLGSVKLKYAGGEPTLNFGLVKRLHRSAHRLADESGLALQEVLLSTGTTLTPAMCRFMSRAGMRRMISLDGVGAAHNAQRPFADGRGSFPAVVRGLELALAHGLRPHLSITVTGRNVDSLAETVAFALEYDTTFNLNFCRSVDGDMRPPVDRLIDGMRAAFAVVEKRLPRQRLLSALVDRGANFGSLSPCGAGQNYLAIDQQGRVARCQMELARPVGDIFTADPLTGLRQQADGFQNVAVDQKEGCGHCQWRYWCAGGCPLLTYYDRGRSDVKSPYCEVYKALYPAVLHLEGLRLLKWGAPLH